MKKKRKSNLTMIASKFLIQPCIFQVFFILTACLSSIFLPQFSLYAQSTNEKSDVVTPSQREEEGSVIKIGKRENLSDKAKLITEKGEMKLKEIQSRLHLLHGKLTEEYPEQLMSATYIPEDAKVLELGGNVGRNSCVIGSILNDSNNLVVAESCETTAKQLQENRNHNGLHFHIEASAVSKTPLVQNFWNTIPSEVEIPGYFRVKTITFEELEKKYNITFDTLVVDCEGALYYMLKDDPQILKNIQLIIIENDFVDPAHYKYVASLFVEKGLRLVYTRPLENVPTRLPCKDYFFQVWSK